ncbi:hypothetical protein IU402_05335 [Aerococcaceae bacterium zg-BR9]|uniref:hypothetical protein n=1 Tax=Aerococcaceae bacterium zg-1292 TaxID=2774330 RepID=UPI004063AC14|nr:hypothetical protein [Aerococcaceae bacterium zg-BR9]
MDYDGPVFKKASEQKTRRFQQRSMKQKRQFELKHPSLLDETTRSTTRYTLPESAKGLRHYQNLTPPVNANSLDHRIEQAHLTQDEKMKSESEYQVPFLNKTKKSPVWQPSIEAKDVMKTRQPCSKCTLAHNYQPALKASPIVQAVKSESSVVVAPAKSIDAQNIRVISTRLVKDKSSYLLFADK